MNKVNIFFLFRKDSCTRPSGHAIRHFLPLCHICFVIPAFCGSFMQYSDYYHTGRRHIHKGSPHYAKKKKQIVFMQVREVHNVNHEILGVSLCDNHNRCPFLLLLWIFGRPPKTVIDYQRYHNASKQLAA